MKKIAILFVIISTLFQACSKTKDKDPSPSFNEVEYRLESSTSNVVTEINYVNESGGVTTLENQPLPFSIKVKREVKNATVSYMIAHIHNTTGNSQSLTGSILVDGKVAVSKTGV